MLRGTYQRYAGTPTTPPDRRSLLAAQLAEGSQCWRVGTGAFRITLRPFAGIGHEGCSATST